MKIRITAEKDFDLSDLFFDINDGLIDQITKPDEIKTDRQAPKLFAGGDERVVKLDLIFKKPLSTDDKAALLAEIRRLVGSKAHIVEID